MKKTVRVGVFDSGIGGLTVLSACLRELPEVQFLYFGDNAHAPYGSRSPAEITAFVRNALRRFQELGVSAAVLACNTATAVCAEEMRREFPFPVVGMEPAVRPAARACKNILVLCTPRTAESSRLKRLVEGYPESKFTVFPAEGLAGAIEGALIKGKAFSLADHLPKGEFDGVVLGCTHYVFFRGEISAFYGAPTFDGNEGAARRLRALLEEISAKTPGISNHFCKELNYCQIQPESCPKMNKKNIIFVNPNKYADKSRYKQTFANYNSQKSFK